MRVCRGDVRCAGRQAGSQSEPVAQPAARLVLFQWCRGRRDVSVSDAELIDLSDSLGTNPQNISYFVRVCVCVFVLSVQCDCFVCQASRCHLSLAASRLCRR